MTFVRLVEACSLVEMTCPWLLTFIPMLAQLEKGDMPITNQLYVTNVI
jgi:hypothetical protein